MDGACDSKSTPPFGASRSELQELHPVAITASANHHFRPFMWSVLYRYTLYRRHELSMSRRQKWPRVKCYGGLYRPRRQPLQDALLEEIKVAVKDMPLGKYGSNDEVTLVGSEEKKKWSDVLGWD